MAEASAPVQSTTETTTVTIPRPETQASFGNLASRLTLFTIVVLLLQEVLVLRLCKPKTDKKVQWDENVVDNEFLGRKSSKCCCIYTPPKKDEEDSDSDSDDCCHEHRVARRKIPLHRKNPSSSS